VKLRKKSPCNSCTSRERTKADLALVIQQQEHKKTSSFWPEKKSTNLQQATKPNQKNYKIVAFSILKTENVLSSFTLSLLFSMDTRRVSQGIREKKLCGVFVQWLYQACVPHSSLTHLCTMGLSSYGWASFPH
jgi:hypothetical protein